MPDPAHSVTPVNGRPWSVRNQVIILGFEFFWGLSWAMSNLTTVATGYIQWLGFPQVVVGLLPALYWGIYGLVQPLAPYVIPPGRNVFRKVLLLFGAAALCILSLGVASSTIVMSSGLRLLLLFTCFLAFISLVGLGDPQYISVVFRAVPDHQRGRFFGARALALGIGGCFGSGLLGLILSLGEPRCYHNAFAASGIGLAFGVAWFALYRPPVTDFSSARDRPKLSEVLGSLVARVAGNRPLLLFLGADILFSFAVFGGFPLYAGIIRGILEADERTLGHLTLAFWAANCLFSIILGWWADRAGYKRTFMTVLACFAVGTSMLLFRGGGTWYYLAAYFLASIWLPGVIVAGFTLAQACAEDLEPAETLIAISVCLLPVRLLSPVVIGKMIDLHWTSGAILLCSAVTVLAGIVLGLGIDRKTPSMVL